MNVYHQVTMSLRHYLSFTQLWRLILPLAYIGQTASKSPSPDDPGDGKGAVFLTREIQDPNIHFSFDAYFEVSLQVLRRNNSDNYSVTTLTYELAQTEIHMKILPKPIKVEPGDLLRIKIRNASSPLTNDARPCQLKLATTTPKPQLSTTGYLDVSHSSTRVETKKPPIDTTTLTFLQPTTSAPERKSDTSVDIPLAKDTTTLTSLQPTTSAPEGKSNTSVDIPLAKDGTTSPGEDHIGGPSMSGLKTTQPAMDSSTQQTNVMVFVRHPTTV